MQDTVGPRLTRLEFINTKLEVKGSIDFWSTLKIGPAIISKTSPKALLGFGS